LGVHQTVSTAKVFQRRACRTVNHVRGAQLRTDRARLGKSAMVGAPAAAIRCSGPRSLPTASARGRRARRSAPDRCGRSGPAPSATGAGSMGEIAWFNAPITTMSKPASACAWRIGRRAPPASAAPRGLASDPGASSTSGRWPPATDNRPGSVRAGENPGVSRRAADRGVTGASGQMPASFQLVGLALELVHPWRWRLRSAAAAPSATARPLRRKRAQRLEDQMSSCRSAGRKTRSKWPARMRRISAAHDAGSLGEPSASTVLKNGLDFASASNGWVVGG